MPNLEPVQEPSAIDERVIRELQEQMGRYEQRLTADVEPALLYFPAVPGEGAAE